MINNEIIIENLGNNIKIFTSKKFKFTMDTILLAHFSYPKNKENILEFCSGCGTIPLIWYRDGFKHHTTCIEIQSEACELFHNSIKINNLESNIEIINDNINHIIDYMPLEKFNQVTFNPPYFSATNSINSTIEYRNIARSDIVFNIDETIKICSKLLKNKGDMFLCYRPDRFCEVVNIMKKYSIEPKIVQIVQHNIYKRPKLILIKGTKNSNIGIQFLPTLTIYDENNKFTPTASNIYKYFAK